MSDETCPKCGAEKARTYNPMDGFESTEFVCGSERELETATGEKHWFISPECYKRQLAAKDAEIWRMAREINLEAISKKRQLAAKDAEIERLKQALEIHGWHADNCWYRSKECTCGFNDAIRARGEK